MEIEKRCQWCGKQFIAHKMTTLYCSSSCVNKAYKAKKETDDEKRNWIRAGLKVANNREFRTKTIPLTKRGSLPSWHKDVTMVSLIRNIMLSTVHIVERQILLVFSVVFEKNPNIFADAKGLSESIAAKNIMPNNQTKLGQMTKQN